MGPLGGQEMFFIVLLALLLFGPKKLPELGRMLGKGLTEFRRAKNELKNTFESHMQELEREAKVAELAEAPKWDQSTTPQSSTYSYPYDEYGQQSSPAELPHASESAELKASEPLAGTVPRSKSTPTTESADALMDENRPA